MFAFVGGVLAEAVGLLNDGMDWFGTMVVALKSFMTCFLSFAIICIPSCNCAMSSSLSLCNHGGR